MTEMEMNNTNYQRSKERLLKQAQNRYHHEGVKKRAKEYYKNDKERVQEQAFLFLEMFYHGFRTW